MKNLKRLRDHFAEKVLAHKYCYGTHLTENQRKRHLYMYGYNLHIMMTLHAVMQRIAYEQTEKKRRAISR